jgi:hypothetical protein
MADDYDYGDDDTMGFDDDFDWIYVEDGYALAVSAPPRCAGLRRQPADVHAAASGPGFELFVVVTAFCFPLPASCRS